MKGNKDVSKAVFETEIFNTLSDFTGWGDHEALIVGVYDVYHFNEAAVSGLVCIQQPEEDDLEQWRDKGDFRDNTCDEIVMTPETARKLAETLLRAADAATASQAKD